MDASRISVIGTEEGFRLEGTVPHYLASHEAALPPTNFEIKGIIENILKWNLNTSDADIAISLDNGKVTMEGFVHTYWKKLYAAELASRNTEYETNSKFEFSLFKTKDL